MYTLLIWLVSAGLHITALWNKKIRLFVQGRKGVMKLIKDAVKGHDDIIWFHAASMGECEEARPVIEAVRKRYPEKKILLTFFSPSGFEAKKNWKTVDWIFYLPLDTCFNAKKFVETVRPSKAVFTIGEFWFNYLRQLKKHNIDTYIMSVLATKDSPYVKWYGWEYRKVLRSVYKCVMVKNDETKEILEGIGCRNVVITGDARFDRVAAIASEDWHDRIVEKWSCGKKTAIAGSSSEPENELFIYLAEKYPQDKFLFVPHDLDEKPIRHILDSLKGRAVLYTDVEYVFSSGIPQNVREDALRHLADAQVLVVNKIGILAKLYRYGWCALIGGGFENLPHSVMEAVIYGMPVSMGPQYHKNTQFVDLMKSGAATPVSTKEEILSWYERFRDNGSLLAQITEIEAKYSLSNIGATQRIMNIMDPQGKSSSSVR